jgi:hypothetical protein
VNKSVINLVDPESRLMRDAHGHSCRFGLMEMKRQDVAVGL